MTNTCFRVALIGPESTGKSSLCEALASAFQTAWVPEYAREFLQTHGSSYSAADVEHMLEIQLKREQEAAQRGGLLFCDTEPINFKVWMEHVYGESPLWIDALIAEKPYDLYLLTSPDLEWKDDPLRENPGKGLFFFEWYLKILEAFSLRYAVISGTGPERLQNAIAAVEEASDFRSVKKSVS